MLGLRVVNQVIILFMQLAKNCLNKSYLQYVAVSWVQVRDVRYHQGY